VVADATAEGAADAAALAASGLTFLGSTQAATGATGLGAGGVGLALAAAGA